MMSFTRGVAAGMLLAALALSGPSQAQTRVDAKKDWSIFEAGDGAQKVCWIVSQPTTKRAVRNGKEVDVRRGDIFLMVAVRPADKVSNEVSYLSGYPFKKGSKVKVTVGTSDYALFTDGENAWTPSPADDDAVTSAFRRGSTAQVEGLSARGTTTIDTFSLSGFTAAMEAATERCR